MTKEGTTIKPADRKWVAAVFDAYSPFLIRYLATRIANPSEAHDLAQEAFFRFARIRDFEKIEDPEAYIFKIAMNLTNEYFSRKKQSGEILDLETLADIGGDGDEGAFERSVEARSATRRLEAILDDMPPMYRAVLLMRKRDGFSHGEIAAKLKISQHTVHRYLTKALARCRAEWDR